MTIDGAIYIGKVDGRIAKVFKQGDEFFDRITLSQLGEQIHTLDAIQQRLNLSITLSALENRIAALGETPQNRTINPQTKT